MSACNKPVTVDQDGDWKKIESDSDQVGTPQQCHTAIILRKDVAGLLYEVAGWVGGEGSVAYEFACVCEEVRVT